MHDLTEMALRKHRDALTRAAIEHELARALPRTSVRVRLARHLRAWAERLDRPGAVGTLHARHNA